MRMTGRDAEIVKTTDAFGQLSSGQIWDLHFHDNASKNSMDRVLQRLVKNRMLSRIERRMVGGTRGGSGQYVYQLGALGHDFLGKRGIFAPAHRTVKQHMLEIVDVFLRFEAEERSGNIRILNYLTEPDTHVDIAGAKLRPDLFLEYELIEQQKALSLWVEVDRGFESLSVISSMVGRYVHVMNHATADDLETIPMILFVVPDDRRLRNISNVINREAKDYKEMFSVQLRESVLTSVT